MSSNFDSWAIDQSKETTSVNFSRVVQITRVALSPTLQLQVPPSMVAELSQPSCPGVWLHAHRLLKLPAGSRRMYREVLHARLEDSDPYHISLSNMACCAVFLS